MMVTLSVYEHDHFVTGLNCVEHHVQAAPPCTGNPVGVGVLRAHNAAEHFFTLQCYPVQGQQQSSAESQV